MPLAMLGLLAVAVLGGVFGAIAYYLHNRGENGSE